MRNLIIAALVLGTASAAMAQGYINMKSTKGKVTLPTGDYVPASFAATLWYEGADVVTMDAAFGNNNGRLAVGKVYTDALPAGADVTLAVEAFGVIDGVAFAGMSDPFTYKTGFETGDPTTTVLADANMQFDSFTVQAVIVPEPTTIALGVLGLGGLLLFRRRD